MNMRQVTIEIARLLIEDPSKKVLCPACNDAILEIRDTINKFDVNVVERHIYCPSCDFETYVRMNKSFLTNSESNQAPLDSTTEAQAVFRFVDKAIKEVQLPQRNTDSLHGCDKGEEEKE